jgi:1-acyl-sn-glycerol-3-phosphate acyltransferase
MILLRRLRKIFLLSVWFCVIFAGAGVDTLFRRRWSAVRAGTKWVKIWAKGAAWIIGLKTVVHGDPAAAAGKLVISNHTGYLDIVAQGGLFPLRFAPKKEMRSWPVLGILVRLAHPVWVDRTNRIRAGRTAQEFKETLENKLALLVYPEGTSTDGRHGLLPFKSTAFEAAISAQVPLLPVLIFHEGVPENSFDPAWYGDIGFLNHIWGVLGLKEIHTRVYIMPEVSLDKGENRKQLSCRMWQLMTEYYENNSVSASSGA